MRTLALLVTLLATSLTARRACADMPGCSCGNDSTTTTPDLATPPDDLRAPADQGAPADLRQQLDARRQRRRAGGRGMITLSAASALALVLARRRRPERR
jgi:hypothetical protein